MKPWPRVLLSLLLLGVFGVLIVSNLIGDVFQSFGAASAGDGRSPSGPRPWAETPWDDRTAFRVADEEPPWHAALLTGQVHSAVGPTPGAEVEWILVEPGRTTLEPTARQQTASSGHFRLEVPPGQLGLLRVTRPGSPPLLRHGLLSPPAEETLDLGRLEFPPAAFLKVRVLDTEEGLPVVGAALILLGPRGLTRPEDPRPRAVTDHEGEAKLGPAAPGPWRLEIRAHSFSPLSRSVVLREAPVPELLTVFLLRGPGLEGRVIDPTGRGVPGLEVHASPRLEGDQDERASTAVLTDGEGRFHFEGLARGAWLLEAHGGRLALPLAQTVHCPSAQPIELEVRPLPALHGLVRTSQGPAPPGTRVFLARPMGQGSSWLAHPELPPADCDPSGRFELLLDSPPGPGPWVLLAQASGLLPAASPPLDLTPGQQIEEQVLTPEEGQEIRGRLVPATGGRISLGWGGLPGHAPFFPAQPPLVVGTDPAGAFRLAPVRPGPHRIRLEAPGRVSKQVRVEVLPGKSVDLGPVLLASGWRPRGILLGLDGGPESGGLVWMVPLPNGEPIQALTGEDGSFRFPPLPAGRYELKACRRDLGDLERLGDYQATARIVELGGRNPEDLGSIRIDPQAAAGSGRPR